MKGLAPESPPLPLDTLQLPIRDMAHMFNPPPVDPLSPGLPEVLGISGAEYVLQQLEIRRPVKLKTVRLVVPEDKFSSGLAGEAEHALQRYAECRIPQQQTLVRETRRHGWRLMGAAIVLLAFFLALSMLFASELTAGLRPPLRKTLEYGFEIVGWVMLWYQIEVLMFQPIAIKSRIRTLRRLMKLRVVAESGGAAFQSPT
jgi:hypothetical protein